MKTVEQMLAEHPFAANLSEDHVKILAHGAAVARFDEDEFIFHEHEEAKAFYLIVEGRVALKIHTPNAGPIPIQTISAGQVLGWSWLIPPYKWHFDARTFSPVTAVVIDGARLRRTLEENTDLGYRILLGMNKVLAERLQATRLQLLDVYQCAM